MIYNINKSNYKKIVRKIIPNNKVIIYYYSKKCPFCIMIEGLIREIKKKYIVSDKIIITVNRDNLNYLDDSMKINMVPTFIYYNKGINKKEFKKKRDYNNIINFIEKSLK